MDPHVPFSPSLHPVDRHCQISTQDSMRCQIHAQYPTRVIMKVLVFAAVFAAIVACTMAMPVSVPENDIECSICEFVVGEVDKLAGSNKTESEVEAEIVKACNILPKSWGGEVRPTPNLDFFSPHQQQQSITLWTSCDFFS